jgi:hypothetical protein
VVGEDQGVRRARTNPGKVIIYTEVAAFMRREWRWYAGAWTTAVALLAVVALLPLDPWVRELWVVRPQLLSC